MRTIKIEVISNRYNRQLRFFFLIWSVFQTWTNVTCMLKSDNKEKNKTSLFGGIAILSVENGH